jgi:ubiquitin related modifier 1
LGELERVVRADASGGLHLLFSAQPRHTVHVPRTVEGKPADVRSLIQWMKTNLVSEREDMFVDGDSV